MLIDGLVGSSGAAGESPHPGDVQEAAREYQWNHAKGDWADGSSCHLCSRACTVFNACKDLGVHSLYALRTDLCLCVHTCLSRAWLRDSTGNQYAVA